MTRQRTLTNMVKTVVPELLKSVGTSIPGNIITFDADRQMATVQIGVERIDIDGNRFTPPPLIECPVYFMGGSNFFIEYQIDPGDECIILFSQRCIDGWTTTGGVASNPILRFHSFDDAMVLPGVRSQPNRISNHANNGVRLRNKDGDNYIWLKNDGTAEITIDTLNINGNINHDGNQTTTGTITGNTDVVAAGISGKGHTHPQGNDSAGNSEQDTGAPQ